MRHTKLNGPDASTGANVKNDLGVAYRSEVEFLVPEGQQEELMLQVEAVRFFLRGD